MRSAIRARGGAHLSEYARSGDVRLVMSNGKFDSIWEKLLTALSERS